MSSLLLVTSFPYLPLRGWCFFFSSGQHSNGTWAGEDESVPAKTSGIFDLLKKENGLRRLKLRRRVPRWLPILGWLRQLLYLKLFSILFMSRVPNFFCEKFSVTIGSLKIVKLILPADRQIKILGFKRDPFKSAYFFGPLLVPKTLAR